MSCRRRCVDFIIKTCFQTVKSVRTVCAYLHREFIFYKSQYVCVCLWLFTQRLYIRSPNKDAKSKKKNIWKCFFFNTHSHQISHVNSIYFPCIIKYLLLFCLILSFFCLTFSFLSLQFNLSYILAGKLSIFN